MTKDLARLAAIATSDVVDDGAVDEALAVLCHALGATDVWLVYGWADDFRCFASNEPLGFTQHALWLINRDLTSRGEPCTFSLTGSHVVDFDSLASGDVHPFVAALVPARRTASQMLIARGEWQGSASASRAAALTAVGPSLARLLEARLDLGVAERERSQLDALINIQRVMSESEDLSDVLSTIARTMATVSGTDYVTIDLVDPEGKVTLRCVNYEQAPDGANDRWRTSADRPDPVRAEVLRTRSPLTFADAASDERLSAGARTFFARRLVRSTGVFPLATRDEVLGVMSIASLKPLAFSLAEVSLFEGFAAQIAGAVQGIRVYQDLADSRAELQEKSALLASALEVERERARRDSLTGVLNHAGITECVRALITEQSNASLAVLMVDVDGMKAVNDTFGHLSGDAVLLAVAGALSQGGAIVGRYGGDEFLSLLPGATRQQAEQYRAAVLRAVEGHAVVDEQSQTRIPVVVSIGIATFPEEAASISDLIKVSDSAMYASKWQRLLARGEGASSRRDDRTARMIGELVPLLTSHGDLNTKLDLVSRRLAVEAGYDAVDCMIFPSALVDRAAQSTVGPGDDFREAWTNMERPPDRQPHLRPILERTRRPLILDDMLTDPRTPPHRVEMLRSAGLRSGIVAPMFWRDELIGVLSVARKEPGAFEAREAQFLAAVATQVTAIVRMSTLVDGLQVASHRLAESHADTVMLLAAAAEAHDHTTGRHLHSMRELSEALANELGYTRPAAIELGLAAVLHDIGKISVPDTILASPLRFDTDDWEVAKMWEVMKQHSVWGSEFLSGRPGFELAAAVARWHHERWDGAGYPDGLRGEDIPETVAIVSVADAFDAMTTDRPYRERRPIAAAVQEIVSFSGKQFSPRVVQALATLQRRNELAPLRERSHDQAA